MSIAYATLDFILKNIKCRTLFATHYHELAHMLGVPSSEEAAAKTGVPFLDPRNVRQGVSFWCTDVDELDGLFAYSYRLKPGVNYDSHAIVSSSGVPNLEQTDADRQKAAQLAGMPDSFLETAERTLQELDTKHDPSH